MTVISNVDMVFGPIQSPLPSRARDNSCQQTLLHMNWPPPFTWTNHSITHYNITLTNTNEGASLRRHSNETSFLLSGAEGCDVLVVNVTASSDIREGQVGQVIGGFPIREWSVYIPTIKAVSLNPVIIVKAYLFVVLVLYIGCANNSIIFIQRETPIVTAQVQVKSAVFAFLWSLILYSQSLIGSKKAILFVHTRHNP